VEGEACATLISEETYEDLLKDHNSLKWKYRILEREFYWLEEDYLEIMGELKEQYSKINIFILTSLVFFAITVYFVWKSVKKRKIEKA